MNESLQIGMSRLTRRQSELQALVGEYVPFSTIQRLLRAHNDSVGKAANAFFQETENATNAADTSDSAPPSPIPSSILSPSMPPIGNGHANPTVETLERNVNENGKGNVAPRKRKQVGGNLLARAESSRNGRKLIRLSEFAESESKSESESATAANLVTHSSLPALSSASSPTYARAANQLDDRGNHCPVQVHVSVHAESNSELVSNAASPSLSCNSPSPPSHVSFDNSDPEDFHASFLRLQAQILHDQSASPSPSAAVPSPVIDEPVLPQPAPADTADSLSPPIPDSTSASFPPPSQLVTVSSLLTAPSSPLPSIPSVRKLKPIVIPSINRPAAASPAAAATPARSPAIVGASSASASLSIPLKQFKAPTKLVTVRVGERSTPFNKPSNNLKVGTSKVFIKPKTYIEKSTALREDKLNETIQRVKGRLVQLLENQCCLVWTSAELKEELEKEQDAESFELECVELGLESLVAEEIIESGEFESASDVMWLQPIRDDHVEAVSLRPNLPVTPASQQPNHSHPPSLSCTQPASSSRSPSAIESLPRLISSQPNPLPSPLSYSLSAATPAKRILTPLLFHSNSPSPASTPQLQEPQQQHRRNHLAGISQAMRAKLSASKTKFPSNLLTTPGSNHAAVNTVRRESQSSLSSLSLSSSSSSSSSSESSSPAGSSNLIAAAASRQLSELCGGSGPTLADNVEERIAMAQSHAQQLQAERDRHKLEQQPERLHQPQVKQTRSVQEGETEIDGLLRVVRAENGILKRELAKRSEESLRPRAEEGEIARLDSLTEKWTRAGQDVLNELLNKMKESGTQLSMAELLVGLRVEPDLVAALRWDEKLEEFVNS